MNSNEMFNVNKEDIDNIEYIFNKIIPNFNVYTDLVFIDLKKQYRSKRKLENPHLTQNKRLRNNKNMVIPCSQETDIGSPIHNINSHTKPPLYKNTTQSLYTNTNNNNYRKNKSTKNVPMFNKDDNSDGGEVVIKKEPISHVPYNNSLQNPINILSQEHFLDKIIYSSQDILNSGTFLANNILDSQDANILDSQDANNILDSQDEINNLINDHENDIMVENTPPKFEDDTQTNNKNKEKNSERESVLLTLSGSEDEMETIEDSNPDHAFLSQKISDIEITKPLKKKQPLKMITKRTNNKNLDIKNSNMK